MKAIGVALVLLLAAIGGGVILLGGGAYFMVSKVDSRAAEIEELMMAEIKRGAPEGWTEEMFEGQRKMVKKLARTAAQMEMSGKLNGTYKSDFFKDLPKGSSLSASSQPIEDVAQDFEANESDLESNDMVVGEMERVTDIGEY